MNETNSYREKLREKSETNLKMIDSFYNNIRSQVLEREKELKKKINDKFAAEEEKMSIINNSLASHLSSIMYLKNEKENIENISDFDFLLKMKNYSNQIDSISIDSNFIFGNKEISLYEMKKEEEIEHIKNILIDIVSDKEEIKNLEKNSIIPRDLTFLHDNSRISLNLKDPKVDMTNSIKIQTLNKDKSEQLILKSTIQNKSKSKNEIMKTRNKTPQKKIEHGN